MITPRVVAGVGENFTPSMISWFGRLTCVTEMAVPPPWPLAGAMRSVSAVLAVLEPAAFFAVTSARIVCATSADAST